MRKFMVTILAALMIAALSGMLNSANAANAANAADKKEKKGKPSPEEFFKKKDKDGDGKISFEEFAGKAASDEKKAEGLKARFGKIDKNGDGSIDQAEFTAAMSKGGDKPAKKKKEKPAEDADAAADDNN